MVRAPHILAAALCGAIIFSYAEAAQAKCRTHFFSVNDYGKAGPTKDAANLLDKHIIKRTKEKGIKKYYKIPKNVKCELFLDFIVFDEYTCTATADVCW